MATAALITKVPKMSTETVRFKDGMIVTAADLTVATEYPLQLMQVLVRAYFGCGVVCGLSLGQDSRVGPRRAVKNHDRPENATYSAEIAAGVALDCAGYPLEVCGPVRIDLTPDPCARPGPIVGAETRTLHIAVRRAQKADSAGQQSGCGCDCDEGGGCGDRDAQCARLRDHVEIGVFEELPEDACRREAETGVVNAAGQVERPPLCKCLTQCPHCHCCGDNWVALGTVTIDRWGITEGGVAHDTRRYIKPVECVCSREGEEAPPASWPAPPEDTYSVKLDEYRNAQGAQIDQLRAAIDERTSQYDELRQRIDRMEARVTEGGVRAEEAQPPTRRRRAAPAAPATSESEASGGAPSGGTDAKP
jgi:hypothetical protein